MKHYILVLLFSGITLSQNFDYKMIGPYTGQVYWDNIAIHPLYPNKIVLAQEWGGVFYCENDIINKVIDLQDADPNRYIVFHPVYPEIIYLQKNRELYKININSGSVELIYKSIISNTLWTPTILFNPKNPKVIYNIREKSIFKSLDDGKTWFLIESFSDYIESFAIATSDSSILYCGTQKTIFRSTNSGNDWEKMYNGYSIWPPVKIVVNPWNANTIYASYHDSLEVSRDGGKTLKKICNISHMSFVLDPADSSTLYIYNAGPIFNTNALLKTTNEGITWESKQNNLPGSYATAISVNPKYSDILYLSNGALGIYKSTNGGNTWESRDLVGEPVSDFYCFPGSDKYLAGEYGWGIITTTNNGKNWIPSQVEGNHDQYVIKNISRNPYASNEFFCSTNLNLLKSADTGKTWTVYPKLIRAVDICYSPKIPNFLIASNHNDEMPGNNDSVWQSTDNGFTWKFIKEERAEIHFDPVNENVIYWVNSPNGLVYKTTNRGITWENKSIGLPLLASIGKQSFAIDPFNHLNLYYSCIASENPGVLSMSTNGGDSWFRIDSSLSFLDYSLNYRCITPVKSKPGKLYVGMHQFNTYQSPEFSNGGLFLTENYGKTWRKLFNSWVSNIYTDDKEPQNIFINTKFGLLKFPDTLTVTSVKHDFISNHSYKLEQNYPNPFNPSTNIRYYLRTGSMVTLKVFNALGEEIRILENGFKAAGNNNVLFNAEKLAAGIYFYRLQAGDFVQTNKMILLK